MGVPRPQTAHGPAGSSGLDWTEVQRRYGGGARLTDVPGRPVEITGVDDQHVHIRSSLWRDSLARADLERAVELIASGELPAHALPTAERPRSFAEEYRRHVADARGSSVAFILRDLGHLE